jgi:hypothetical protein
MTIYCVLSGCPEDDLRTVHILLHGIRIRTAELSCGSTNHSISALEWQTSVTEETRPGSRIARSGEAIASKVKERPSGDEIAQAIWQHSFLG